MALSAEYRSRERGGGGGMVPGASDRPWEGGSAAGDDHLALRIQGGDHQAFLELVEASERELRIVITLYACDLAMVDEVLQATYVTAFENIGRYQPRGTLRAWLKGIARNLLYKELEARSRMHAVDGDLLEELMVASGRRQLDGDPADDQAEARLHGLQQCLLELSPEASRLIRSRYYEDLPLEQIADVFARSRSWVAVTLFRIRKTLLACMRQRGVA
jgi:RNA polymerase sigma-70 factor (ECF subfamily)